MLTKNFVRTRKSTDVDMESYAVVEQMSLFPNALIVPKVFLNAIIIAQNVQIVEFFPSPCT